MAQNTNPHRYFRDLLVAHEADDEAAVQRIRGLLLGLGQPMSVVIEEATSWEESIDEDFSEFPVVTQSFKVFVGDDLVYQGERQFGSSLVDPTHTGLGGRWEAIRIDNEEHLVAERALEDLGLEIAWPAVPPAR